MKLTTNQQMLKNYLSHRQDTNGRTYVLDDLKNPIKLAHISAQCDNEIEESKAQTLWLQNVACKLKNSD